jgi:hypothetical protein
MNIIYCRFTLYIKSKFNTVSTKIIFKYFMLAKIKWACLNVYNKIVIKIATQL